jgi:hypothetical protein
MRFMLINKADADAEADVPPSAEQMTNIEKWKDEMVRAGILLAAEGLRPSSQGTRVSAAAGKVTVIDGPFAETKELVAGFCIIQVKSHDEAVAWATRFVDAWGADCDIEIRKVTEMTDFPPELRPENLRQA